MNSNLAQQTVRRPPNSPKSRDTLIAPIWKIYLEDIEFIRDQLGRIAEVPFLEQQAYESALSDRYDYSRLDEEERQEWPKPQIPDKPVAQVVISTDEYQLLSMETLQKLTDPYLREFQIRLLQPGLSIECNSYGCRVRIPTWSPQVEETADLIIRRLNRRSNRLLKILFKRESLFQSLIFALLVALTCALIGRDINWAFLGFPATWGPWLLLTSLGIDFFRRTGTTVVALSKQEDKGFWESGKAAIVTGLVGTLVGAAISAAATFLVTR